MEKKVRQHKAFFINTTFLKLKNQIRQNPRQHYIVLHNNSFLWLLLKIVVATNSFLYFFFRLHMIISESNFILQSYQGPQKLFQMLSNFLKSSVPSMHSLMEWVFLLTSSKPSGFQLIVELPHPLITFQPFHLDLSRNKNF